MPFPSIPRFGIDSLVNFLLYMLFHRFMYEAISVVDKKKKNLRRQNFIILHFILAFCVYYKLIYCRHKYRIGN
jgi:hypothetical protein